MVKKPWGTRFPAKRIVLPPVLHDDWFDPVANHFKFICPVSFDIGFALIYVHNPMVLILPKVQFHIFGVHISLSEASPPSLQRWELDAKRRACHAAIWLKTSIFCVRLGHPLVTINRFALKRENATQHFSISFVTVFHDTYVSIASWCSSSHESSWSD